MSSFGVSLKEFYCCGKLTSIAVTLADGGKDKREKGDLKNDCCKTKYKFFKVKDNQLTPGELTIPVKLFTDIVSFNPTYQSILSRQQVEVINGSHAPPLYWGVPIYICNCVFRV
jgi:hypothetical protein